MEENNTGMVVFWSVVIISTIIGIITKFWINTFLVGFVILPIISFIVIILNERDKADVERYKYTSRSMYCHSCHKQVVPSYVVGVWVWNCHYCGRTWTSKW